ncbi:hypothetical protein F7734_33255 [Scytonema sp. UIC 10036]|uniref:hypothetical protein n=1 Tax=Scytonema sp. UIC 10036 TaxID=2304196 RepID=UPI0012DA6BE9|nr:hypothetical protein [Scytonema sp. UIC 10036]MUG96948.1 hypothetical protein [Scytonema sp. UIC 10036]
MSQKTINYYSFSINNIYSYVISAIFLLAIILGLLALNKGLWGDEIVCCILLSINYSVNWITNQAYKPVEEYRTVVQLVESEWPPNDLILCYPSYSQKSIDYYFQNIPSDKQILVWKPDKISNFYLNQKELDVFLIVKAGNVAIVKDYNAVLSNILSTIKSKKINTLKINLYFIKGHDAYFSKEYDSIEKFVVASESKLGKPYFYQDFGMYLISKYMVAINND